MRFFIALAAVAALGMAGFVVYEASRVGPEGPLTMTGASPGEGDSIDRSASVTSSESGLYDVDTLRTFYFTFASPTWSEDLREARQKKTHVRGDLEVDGVLYKDVGVRFRGKSSYTGVKRKKSLKVTIDAFIPGQELMGYDKLNLNNGFNDPTFCREVIAYGLFRKYIPAPQANFVKVFINGTYSGLFVNVQQIDKKFLGQWFVSKKGNRYRAIADRSALQWLGTELHNYETQYELKTKLGKADRPWEDLRNLCDILNNTPPKRLEAALSAIFDVDRALWYLALNNVSVNVDSYFTQGNDYFLYHDTYHGQITLLPWDLNECFGANPCGLNIRMKMDLSPFYNVRSSRPLLDKMFNTVLEWRARYLHHIRTLTDEDFNWGKIGPLVAKYQNLIDIAVRTDPTKLYSYAQFKGNVTKAIWVNWGSYHTNVPGIKQLVDGRVALLEKTWADMAPRLSIAEIAVTPAKANVGAPVIITAKIRHKVALGRVTLYYREVGVWQRLRMADDGKHGDGAANDEVYGATIPGSMHATSGQEISYYIGALSASRSNATAAYYPNTAAFGAPTYGVH